MLESGDAPESQQIKAIRCCAYKDCNIQIEFPMWGKYCKSHRQKVYKKNYQKKKCKLKEKYKESKECFSGSPDFFDGQDINEMLQQVLFKKRMELMCCPSVVSFLKKHQEVLKAKARENIEQPILLSADKLSSLNKDSKQLHGFSLNPASDSTENWMHQKIIPERLDRGLLPNVQNNDTEISYDFKPELESFPPGISLPGHQPVVKLEISPRRLYQEAENPFLSNAKISKPDIDSNKLFNVKASPSDPERKSAFLETGAGDVKSLIAVRTVQQMEMKS